MTDERFHQLHAKCRAIIEALQTQYQFPRSDCEDMEQEMALALLRIDGHTDSYCLARAAWAALDWLRKTHGTRLLHGIHSVADMAALVDNGVCRRVWI